MEEDLVALRARKQGSKGVREKGSIEEAKAQRNNGGAIKQESKGAGERAGSVGRARGRREGEQERSQG